MLTIEAPLDPRARRTRRHIEDAFLELLNEKTLYALTIGEITDRAGLNRATFYGHFFDKYALFSHMVRKTFLETLHEHVQEGAAFSPQNMRALIAAVCSYFVYLNAQCPPSDRQLRPVAETAVQEVLCAYLTDWLQEQPAIENVAMTATYLSWAIFGVGLEWVANRSASDIDLIGDRIFDLAMKTLGQ